MTQEPLLLTEKERGKRRTAFRVEMALGLLILASLAGVQNAFEILSTTFIPLLMYAGSLRGLDAHYNPKRMHAG